MIDTPFYLAAQEWLVQVQKNSKVTKNMRKAVLSFSIWMDDMMRKQEQREEIEHGKEN